MAKEVSKVEENAFSNFSSFKSAGPVVGLDVNQSDIRLPKIKIMQLISPEVSKSDGKIKPGQLLNTVTGEAVDSIDCILLDQGKSMVMWPKPFKRGEDALCRSFDGKFKTEGIGDGNCEICKYSSQNPKVWSNLQQNETKPACNMSYVFLAQDAKTGTPFRFIAAGASVRHAKSFLNKLIPLGVSPFACKVTLSTAQEQNDSGMAFYTMQFNNLRPNDECLTPDGALIQDKYDELETLSKSLKELFMTQIVQNDVIEVDETTPNPDSQDALF